jgi:hypothetical protein
VALHAVANCCANTATNGYWDTAVVSCFLNPATGKYEWIMQILYPGFNGDGIVFSGFLSSANVYYSCSPLLAIWSGPFGGPWGDLLTLSQ